MNFYINLFRITKEQRYKIFLWLAYLLFLIVSLMGSIKTYRSYRQCKAMEEREQYQFEQYQLTKNKLEVQREHVRELEENLEFVEHVARERMQMVGENEILFRFE